MRQRYIGDFLQSKYSGVPYAAFGGTAIGGIVAGNIFPEGSAARYISAAVATIGFLGLAGYTRSDQMLMTNPQDTNVGNNTSNR